MSVEIMIVFGLILLVMVLFAMDSIPFDLVAMILMSALLLTGILDVKEGLSGFSNPATVTIAAMIALSKGIQKTGVLRSVSRFLDKIGQWSLPNMVLVIMGIIALVSMSWGSTWYLREERSRIWGVTSIRSTICPTLRSLPIMITWESR